MDVCCVYSRLLWPEVFRNTTETQKNGRFCVFYLFFFKKQLMKYWKHIMHEVICEVIFCCGDTSAPQQHADVVLDRPP